MKKLPPLSEARKRLDDNVKSSQGRALGSIRVAWGDLVVIRDALIAGETLARQATSTLKRIRELEAFIDNPKVGDSIEITRRRTVDPLEPRIMRDPL
jgi:hypothetical protein